MWNVQTYPDSVGQTVKYTIKYNAQVLSFAQTLDLWRTDSAFRSCFMTLLADSPFPKFRWETPAVSLKTSHRDFEFVLVNSPELRDVPDPHSFAQYFKNIPQDQVTTFANLGRDAILIVPCPAGPTSAYAHFATFLRQAPESQKHSLLQRLAEAMSQRLSDRPVWLNTAGAGVPWLHVRLDDRPKYYRYDPYRNE